MEILSHPGGPPGNEAALQVYEALAESRGVVVRFRGKEYGCAGCLRITVGTAQEVTKFLAQLEAVLLDIYRDRSATGGHTAQAALEANHVVA